MNKTKLKKGNLLIAELALTGDASFSRAIVFLTVHNEEGSVGFILNKKAEHKLSDLLPGIDPKEDFDLYLGGPVDRDNLYFLHNIPHKIPGSTAVAENIYWGGDFSALYESLKNGEIGEDEIKFFLGYSGWSPHQLQNEIEAHSWIVSDRVSDQVSDILKTTDATLWKGKLQELGGEYLIWANSPENPSLN